MTDTTTAEQYRDMAKRKRAEAQKLIDQYGHGRRPSSVSTDLAVAYEWARKYENAATTLEMHHEESGASLHDDIMFCETCDEKIGAPGVPELCPHCGEKLVDFDPNDNLIE